MGERQSHQGSLIDRLLSLGLLGGQCPLSNRQFLSALSSSPLKTRVPGAALIPDRLFSSKVCLISFLFKTDEAAIGCFKLAKIMYIFVLELKFSLLLSPDFRSQWKESGFSSVFKTSLQLRQIRSSWAYDAGVCVSVIVFLSVGAAPVFLVWLVQIKTKFLCHFIFSSLIVPSCAFISRWRGFKKYLAAYMSISYLLEQGPQPSSCYSPLIVFFLLGWPQP